MPERIIATFSAVFIVRRAAHARACGTRNAAYVGENQQVSRQEILRRRNAAGRSAACEAFPGVADTDTVRLEAAQFLFLSSLFVFSMTGPATKAARSARAIPLQPRPSRCRPPAVRRSACPWGSRGRNANASAGHVRDDHQLFNGSAISSSPQMLWSHSRGLLRAVDLEQVGVVHEYGISAVLVKHPVAATLGSLKKTRLREPPFGPCTAPGTAGQPEPHGPPNRSSRPSVRPAPSRKDRPLPVRLFQRGARPRNHPSGRTTPSYAALPPFGTGGASVCGFAPKGKHTARIRAVKKGFLGEAGRNP